MFKLEIIYNIIVIICDGNFETLVYIFKVYRTVMHFLTLSMSQIIKRRKKIWETLLNFWAKLGHMDKLEIIQYYFNKLWYTFQLC